ncbi:MAG: DnaJ domain-containing protein [Deltaproteobacteria bacterium]|nr:DnaJ domain-containing protein [Deltaproteobacteria bacterium]
MMKVLLSVLGLSYLVSPYDLFPDFFIGVGWLDDLVVLGALWWYLYVYKRRPIGYQKSRPGSDQHRSQAFRDGNDKSNSKEENSAFTGRKDPHTVLKVDRGASQKKIREAYLELANQYHPDKVAHLGDEFRALAENRFKEIQGAYEALKVR